MAREKNVADLKPGMVFYNRNGDIYKNHVVAILDEPKRQVVYKYYGKHKQWWHYKVESEDLFLYSLQIGLYLFDRKAFE